MEILDNQEKIQILNTMLVNTKTGILTWSENKDRTGRFDAGNSKFKYAIWDRDGDEFAPYDLYVWNAILESPIIAIEWDVSDELHADSKKINDLLLELYALVTAKARGLENIYSDLLENMKDDDPFEPF
ncbi:MAG TPA: hypothetical protein VII67_03940 [Acidimicrobiales bacterium]